MYRRRWRRKETEAVKYCLKPKKKNICIMGPSRRETRWVGVREVVWKDDIWVFNREEARGEKRSG